MQAWRHLGAFRIRAPKSLLVPYQTRNMLPPSEDCAPKKVTGSMPLECSSVSEIPKILIINPVFVGKNRFFADFAMKTFFALHPRNRRIVRIFCYEDLFFLHPRILLELEGNMFFPPKLIMPPSHATLVPGLCYCVMIYF